MAVQQVSGQQSQQLWAELRRLVSQIGGSGNGPSLGNDSLTLSSSDPNALFNLPAKGTLGPSDSGTDVQRLQQALRYRGYYTEPTNPGGYGLLTGVAVKNFPAYYGLPTLGEAGVNTRKALADALGGRIRPTRTGGYTPPTSNSSGWTPPTSTGWTSPSSGNSTPPVSAPPPPVSSAQAPSWNGLPNPNSYFTSQMYDSRFNPYAPYSTANCGPTSLAMVLRAFGKTPSYTNLENLIDQVRYQMTGRNDNNELTNENQVMRAASYYGLSSQLVNNVSDVERQLKQGKLVVLAGNPASYNYPFSSNQYFGFSGGHFIVVSDIQGDRVVVNDPLSRVGAIVISRKHLEEYMSYKNWNSGVALGPL